MFCIFFRLHRWNIRSLPTWFHELMDATATRVAWMESRKLFFLKLETTVLILERDALSKSKISRQNVRLLAPMEGLRWIIHYGIIEYSLCHNGFERFRVEWSSVVWGLLLGILFRLLNRPYWSENRTLSVNLFSL